MAMQIGRMLLQNTYYFLVSGFRHIDPEFESLPVVVAYPRDSRDMQVPSVSIFRSSSTINDFELGTQKISRGDIYTVSVFAMTDGQRDDIADRVKEIFDGASREFLDFNQGFSGGQGTLGTIFFDFINMRSVRNMGSQMTSKQHRMDIDISAEYIHDISS